MKLDVISKTKKAILWAFMYDVLRGERREENGITNKKAAAAVEGDDGQRAEEEQDPHGFMARQGPGGHARALVRRRCRG